MYSFPEEWAEIFALIGSEERLSIMIVLHGSDYIRHSHISGESEKSGSLSFSQILEATDIQSDAKLSYHLSKLIEGRLINKIPYKDLKERVFPLYKPSEKWLTFASGLQIDEKIQNYIKEKFPDDYVEPKE